MSAVRRAAAIATDLSYQAMGRRAVVRAARYVLWRARLDFPNDLHANGESVLRGRILRCSPPGEAPHAADVGANAGAWSQSMLAAAARAGREADLRLHTFEPDPAAFTRLARALDGGPTRLSRTS